MFGPFSGFAAAVWQVLTGRRTILILLSWLAVGAVVGVVAGPGEHPAEGVLMHVPALLLPFAWLARSISGVGRFWAAGAALALIGTLFSGGEAGRMTVQPGAETERYLRPSISRPISTHLGGIVRAQADDEHHIALRFGAGTQEQGSARLSLVDGREARLGPWAVRHRRSLPGESPNVARVRALATGQAPQSLSLRRGQSATLADGTVVSLVELASDFGQGLGPAAQLEIREGEASRVDWFFVDGPDLDARLGRGNWRFELAGVDAAPALELDVHRAGNPWVAVAGWGLMALVMLALATRRPTEAA
jgi:hypothetical protein